MAVVHGTEDLLEDALCLFLIYFGPRLQNKQRVKFSLFFPYMLGYNNMRSVLSQLGKSWSRLQCEGNMPLFAMLLHDCQSRA